MEICIAEKWQIWCHLLIQPVAVFSYCSLIWIEWKSHWFDLIFGGFLELSNNKWFCFILDEVGPHGQQFETPSFFAFKSISYSITLLLFITNKLRSFIWLSRTLKDRAYSKNFDATFWTIEKACSSIFFLLFLTSLLNSCLPW